MQHLVAIIFEGKYLAEIGDDELTCDPKKILQQSTTHPTMSSISGTTSLQKKPTEMDIIWSTPVTDKIEHKVKTAPNGLSTLNNDDTLIIGIVGGVVAFIAILIIVICIIR